MPDKKTGENLIGKGKAGPGRPPGAPNKTTALLKDAILQAAQQAGGEGGIVGYLTLQAEENPGPFMSLLGKVLPIQTLHGGDPDNPLPASITLSIVRGNGTTGDT